MKTIPLHLEGDDLIQWTKDKIAAQRKLATYFEDQAIFLSQGNTKADWLKFKRREKTNSGRLLKQLGVGEQDIQDTMNQLGWTRKQVIDELQKRSN